MKLKTGQAIPVEHITEKIYLIRSMKVMLDRDLADLYQVETRALKQAVRRNIERFPRILCSSSPQRSCKIGDHNL